MTDDLIFSERFAIIYMTNYFRYEKLEISGLIKEDKDKILQSILDKLGGNIELNRKLLKQ